MGEFRKHLRDVELHEKSNKITYIVKPEASAQGKGIYLTKNANINVTQSCVVQRYIENPLLIDGYKFDIRL